MEFCKTEKSRMNFLADLNKQFFPGLSSHLQVSRQSQHGAVHLALIDASAVPHTLHPQPLHVGGGRDDVGAQVGRAPPVGQHCGHQSPHKAQHSQEEAQDLHRHVGHDAVNHLD